MVLRLTPDLLAAEYDKLCHCRPFNRQKLPSSDQVEFRVTRHKDRFGHFDDFDGRKQFPCFAISEVLVKTHKDLTETMAHEMAHGVLFVKGDKTWETHGKSFNALAGRICKANGFDPKTF